MPDHRDTEWPALLRLALDAIDALESEPTWSWGGGTALAQHLGHRLSFDIDIFVGEADALRLLSPQRNPITRAITDRWQEPGHYLKLERAEGEIDFIVSRLFTEPGTESFEFEGRDVPLETVAEILSKKLHWRGSNAPARDVFDLAAAHKLAPDEFRQAAAAVPDGAIRAADFIRQQVSRLKRELPAAVNPTPEGEQYFKVDLLSLANDLEAGGE